jgi:hypothetical protein
MAWADAGQPTATSILAVFPPGCQGLSVGSRGRNSHQASCTSASRLSFCRAIGDVEGRHRRHDEVAGGRVGAPWQPAQRDRARYLSDGGRDGPTAPGRQPAWLRKKANPTGRLGELRELANLADFLLADGCAWLSGETIAIDGGHHLANGAYFTNYMDWTDAQWNEARDRIKAQTAKDKQLRTATAEHALPKNG